MSSDSESIKRTKKEETDGRKRAPEFKNPPDSPPKKKSNLIWLYAAHPRLVTRAVARIVNFGSKPAIQFRQQLNLSLEDPLIPVYPYPASARIDVLPVLEETGFPTLITGLPTDKDFKELHKHYKGKVVWVHPPERQFHIDMAGASTSITFQHAEEQMAEWQKFLNKHFDTVQIVRL